MILPVIDDSIGLCLSCRWMRVVTTRRGSTFYRCGRADTDPRFPRYPPLPVRHCVGYEEGRPETDEARKERGGVP